MVLKGHGYESRPGSVSDWKTVYLSIQHFYDGFFLDGLRLSYAV